MGAVPDWTDVDQRPRGHHAGPASRLICDAQNIPSRLDVMIAPSPQPKPGRDRRSGGIPGSFGPARIRLCPDRSGGGARARLGAGGPEAVNLYTVADSTQIAPRELVGITKLDRQGRGLVAAHHQRSKLDAVLGLLLASLVVTAPGLAASLRITPNAQRPASGLARGQFDQKSQGTLKLRGIRAEESGVTGCYSLFTARMRAAVIFLAHVWAALGTASAFLFVTGWIAKTASEGDSFRIFLAAFGSLVLGFVAFRLLVAKAFPDTMHDQRRRTGRRHQTPQFAA